MTAATPASVTLSGSTAAFARFIAASGTRVLPADIRAATLRGFVNWLACVLGAVEDIDVGTVLTVAMRLSGREQASVVGRGERLDTVNAALVNGFAANALDFDDMHVPTLIHPTVPVVAAALAVGEDRHASGRDLVNAIATGIEVECRLGLALFPAHYDAGWHSTATLGTLGAAAAACAIAGLDEARTAHALGIAATQASGLRAMLPNPCKSWNTGHAASSGVMAMLMAEAGLDSEPAVFEAKFGLFHALGTPKDAAALVAGLGGRWIVPEVSLKPYPCGVVIHPLIDACLDVAVANDLTPQNVASLEAHVQPRAIELAGRQHPETSITGRFSLYHAAALALSKRSAGLRAFEDNDVRDEGLTRLRGVMAVKPDAALKPSEARVRVTLTDGRVIEHAVKHPSGSPERPLSESQLGAKFMELASAALDAERAKALYTAALALDTVADVNELRRHWAK